MITESRLMKERYAFNVLNRMLNDAGSKFFVSLVENTDDELLPHRYNIVTLFDNVDTFETDDIGEFFDKVLELLGEEK